MKRQALPVIALIAMTSISVNATEISCKVYASNVSIPSANDSRTIEARVKNTTDQDIWRFYFILNAYDCPSTAKYLSECDKIAEKYVNFGRSKNDRSSTLFNAALGHKEVSVYIPSGQTRTYEQTVGFDYILSANGTLNYSCTNLNAEYSTPLSEILKNLK